MHHKPLLMDDMRPMGSDEPSGKAPKRSRADAVSHLLKEHGPSLTGFVRRRLKSPQAVKDVIQEVWARILAAGDAPILNEVGHLFGTALQYVGKVCLPFGRDTAVDRKDGAHPYVHINI